MSQGGNYYEELTNCNGADNTIISNLACQIPLATLRTGSFSLPYNAAILVKISATNAIGVGPESTVNAATTKMQTKPV
jgi:hypothetical protein